MPYWIFWRRLSLVSGFSSAIVLCPRPMLTLVVGGLMAWEMSREESASEMRSKGITGVEQGYRDDAEEELMLIRTQNPGFERGKATGGRGEGDIRSRRIILHKVSPIIALFKILIIRV